MDKKNIKKRRKLSVVLPFFAAIGLDAWKNVGFGLFCKEFTDNLDVSKKDLSVYLI